MSGTNCVMSPDIINKIIDDIITQSGKTPTLSSLKEVIENYVNESNISFNQLTLDEIKLILTSILQRLGPTKRNPNGKLILSSYDLINLSVLFNTNSPVTNFDEDSTTRLLGDKLKDIYTDNLFLENYYESAPKTRMYVDNLSKRKLVESFLYTVDEFGNKHILLTQEQINDSIYKVLQQLLKTIAEYLKSMNQDILKEYIKTANDKIKEQEAIENKGKPEEKWKHKRLLSYEAISGQIRRPQLNPASGNSSFFAFLRYFPNEFVQPNNLDLLIDSVLTPTEENKMNKLKFDAYNAFVILSNFDNFVNKLFGKLVSIDETKKLFAKGRYVINNIGSNLYTTWRSSDEIWLDKEINTIGQLLITTTPYYTRGNSNPEPLKFLKFNLFNYVIGKLKRFSIGVKDDLKLNDEFNMFTLEGNNLLDETSEYKLSLSSLQYISENNISNIKELIWASRENPLEAWNVILEILSKCDTTLANKLFGIDENDKKGFQNEDINIYYSLYKEIMGGEQSLASTLDSKVGMSEYNYVANIAQIMDSVFKTSYILYYEDSKSGEIKIRPLSDLSIYNIRTDIERKVNNQLSSINYDSFKSKYGIDIIKDKDGIVTNVQFVLNDYIVDYNPVSNEYILKKGDKTLKNIPEDLLYDIYEIESLTGLDISSREFLVGWNNTQNTNFQSIEDLVNATPSIKKLAMLSIVMAALNNEIFIDLEGKPFNSRSELDESIKKVFSGKIIPGVNEVSQNANVTNDSNYLIFDNISEALAYSIGIITSSLIKSGDGNNVSANALSRLGDGYVHQWYLQNFKDDSASNHFILLNNPGFLGLFLVKELKSSDNEVLASEKMTTADMITSNFIHDFLGQISTNPGDKSIIYIIPQVISDKKFIGRLGIDLDGSINLLSLFNLDQIREILEIPENVTINPNNIPKTWKEILAHDKYENIMLAIILRDFSKFFYKILDKIKSDYNKLYSEANKRFPVLMKNLYELYRGIVGIDSNIYNFLENFDDAFYLLKDQEYVQLLKEYIASLPTKFKAIIAKYITDNGLNLTLNDIIFNKDLTLLNLLVQQYNSQKENSDGEYISYIDYVGVDLNTINSTKEFFDLVTRTHNIEHPSNPIELIDQIHFVELSDNNGRKHVIKEPLLNIMLERFKDFDSTSEFFDERFLASTSSMIDRGFSYSLPKLSKNDIGKLIVDNKESSVNRNVIANLKEDWFTPSGDIILAKVTYTRTSGDKITVNIRDKSDVRTLINQILKRKYRTRGQISYDIWTLLKDESGFIFTEEEINSIQEEIRLSLSEDDAYKLKGKVAGKLEELYLEKSKSKLDEDSKLKLINEYKEKHDEEYLKDSEGNPLSDEAILNKIFRAPIYSRIEEELKLELIKELEEYDKTLQEVIYEAQLLELELHNLYLSDRDALILTLREEGKSEEEINLEVEKFYQSRMYDLLKYSTNVEINPSVKKYSMMDYLISEEWIASTVGHHMAHPDKILKYGLEITKDLEYWIESAKKDAQNKRNVSVSATVQEFLLGLLSGIPKNYNVAVIDDVKDTLYNVAGDIDKKVKPYDGATFVNPLVVWLENASLGGSKAGTIKKQFVHFYNLSTGNGGIIKTAGFGITNMTMRDMPADLSMHKSMNSMRWKSFENIPGKYNSDLDIKAEDANITVDMNGETVDYGYFYYMNKSDGKYYRRNIKSYDGDYNYTLEECEVGSDGNPIMGTFHDVKVNKVYSNYAVWEMFGGEWSLELNEDKVLVPSEESIIKTVQASCAVGIKKHNGKIRTQRDVHLFMKHSCIHYFATAGAVKQGGANINGKEFYTNGLIPNFQRILMLQAGIQLDKEHDADGEDVSLMTQVISACISRGFTFDKSDKLYKALAKIAEIGLKDDIDTIAKSLGKNINPELHALIIDTYLKAIASDSRPNKAALVMAKKLLTAINKGEDLPLQEKIELIPLSDPAIYRQLESKLAIAISKAAIKIKIDGILSMLCPSHDRIKLYGDKLLHLFSGKGKSQMLQLYELQAEYDTFDKYKKDIYDIQLGRTYRVTYNDGSLKLIEIKTPLDYYNLKNDINNISRINEFIIKGRNLGHYNCTFTAKKEDIKTPSGETITGRSLKFNIFDLQSVYDLFEAKLKKDSKESIIEKTELLLKDLLALKNGGAVLIHGESSPRQVTRINNITPYEVILPKYFKTSFGLDQHDNLSEILDQGMQFFINVLKKRFNPNIPDNVYDVCLKRADGKHIYIKLKSTPKVGLVDKVIKKSTKKGKPIRVNLKGEEMYELSSKNDSILQYEYNGKSYEVIETNNIDHYINQFGDSWDIYVSLLNNSYLKKLDEYIKNRKDVKTYPKVILNYIKEFRQSGVSLEVYNEQSASTDNLVGWKLRKFENTANRMLASLLKSLELIAARIPAQSMQSFMPMKIVGFDNSDTNTAYVSTALIWLLGSDFDIDTATFTRYATGRDGTFIHWSSLANLSHYDLLKASDELPFPTGIENVETKHVTDLIFVVNLNYNLINRDLDGNLELNVSTPSHIKELCKLINYVNQYGIEGLRMLGMNDPRHLTAVELKFIKNLIIEHNTGLYKKSDNYVLDATKNYMLTQMFDIINNPSNLIQAQTPIDNATEPVKNKANDPNLKDARLARTSIPGDPIVKIVGIYKNQTGKTGVGICATGLKAYFAAFYSCSQILNNKQSSKEELRRALFGNRGIYIKGKKYYGLVNSFTLTSTTGEPLQEVTLDLAKNIARRLYLEDNLKRKLAEAEASNTIYTPTEEDLEIRENPVTEDELRQLITYTTSKGVDGAVLLSAMLSSATDNAKDGSLGKLNAGDKTLGIYIFGIVLGIPFDELSDILMSPSGRVLSLLTQGNTFSTNLGLDSIGQAIKYVRSGPKDILLRIQIRKVEKNIAERIFEELYYDRYKNEDGTVDKKRKHDDFIKEWEGEEYIDDDGQKHERVNSNKNFNKFLIRMFGKLVDVNDRNISDSDKPLCGKNHKQVASKIFRLASRLALDSRIVYGDNNTENLDLAKEKRELWKVVADFAQARLTAYADYDNFEALSTLTEGAGEFTTLGQILKLNQGLPATELEILKTLQLFEEIFRDSNDETLIEKFGETFSIDAFFRNPQLWIDYYEKTLKKAINILDVINRTPHFRKYLLALLIYDEKAKLAIKYRTIRTILPDVSNILKFTNKLKILAVSTANKLVDRFMQEQWMKERALYFVILKGQKYYDSNGSLHEAKSPMKIYLSTRENLATFKLWMDTVVIPNLKNGFNGKTSGLTEISNNRFISDLKFNSYDNTENHVGMIAYSLPASMSPRNDYEESIFNQYKSEFDALTIHESGKSDLFKYFSGDNNVNSEHNIYDLFYLYNLYCFGGQNGLSYLTKIFEDVRDIGLMSDYAKYINTLDRSGEILNIPREYYIYYLTPTGSIFGATTTQIYEKSKDIFGRVLYVLENDDPVSNMYQNDDYDENPDLYDDNPGDYSDEDPEGGAIKEYKRKNKFGKKYVPAYGGNTVINPNFRGFDHTLKLIKIQEMSSQILNFENLEITVNFDNEYVVSIYYKDSQGKTNVYKVIPFKPNKNNVTSETGTLDVSNLEEVKMMLDLILNCK